LTCGERRKIRRAETNTNIMYLFFLMFAILGFDFEMAQHEFGPVDWRITCKNSQKLLFTYFLFIFCVLFDVQLRE